MSLNPNSIPTYMMAGKVATQVGCMLVFVAGGAVIGGLLLDQALGTKPLFLFVLLLVSIPVNIWATYRYVQYQTKQIKASASTRQKEDRLSDD